MKWRRVDPYFGVGIAAVIIGASAFYFMRSDRVSGGADSTPSTLPAELFDSLSALEVAHHRGREDAPAVVVELLDLQCAGCAEFHRRLGEQVDQATDRGHIKLVSYHAPLRRHVNGLGASIVGMCLARLDPKGYWTFRNQTLKQQARWTNTYFSYPLLLDPISDSTRKNFVGRCVSTDGRALETTLRRGTDLLERAGVTSRPVWAVDGKVVSLDELAQFLKRLPD